MTEIEMQDLLNDKLKQYLLSKNKKLEIGQIVELINLQIIEMFNCDKEKFIDALELFNRNIELNQNLKFADNLNKILISNTDEIYVKGFLSKDSPMLFFYNSDDENPFAKITTNFHEDESKYSIEISNNSKVLENYKKGKSISNAYLVNIDYVYNKDTVAEYRNIFAETKLAEESKFLNKVDESNYLNEYINFLNLIKNANQNSGIDLSKISGFSLDILFNNFYDEIKNLCFDEYNLSLDNIVHLINSTIYSDGKFQLKNPKSKFVQMIESIDLKNELTENKKMKIKINRDSHVIEYDIVKSEKYLSIDVIENNKKQCGLMIISTADGFSAFVSNGNSKLKNKSAFVINYSTGQLKVMSVNDKVSKVKNNDFETTISFDNEYLKFNFLSNICKQIKRDNKKNIEDSSFYVSSAIMQ